MAPLARSPNFQGPSVINISKKVFLKQSLGIARWLVPAVYLVDVGIYYCQIVWGAPFCSPDTDVAAAFRVRRLEWSDKRFLPGISPLSTEAAAHIATVAQDRGRVPLSSYYANQYQFVQLDPLEPRMRLDVLMPGIKKMIECRGGQVVSPRGITTFKLPVDLTFRRSLGADASKIRIVHRARFAHDEAEAINLFAELEEPDKTLVVVAPAGTYPDQDPPQENATKVTFFSANRLVVQVTGTPGWLFYADGYHPAWKASINGRAAPVLLANVGCKAVRLEAGDSEVTFYYDSGVRGWIRLFLVSLYFCSGCMLTALVILVPLAASWPVQSDLLASGSLENAVSQPPLMSWLCASLAFLLACAIWIY